MPQHLVDALHLAGRQHGVVSRRQLLEVGVPSSTIAAWSAGGVLQRLLRGIYALHGADHRLQRIQAAVLAAQYGAVASHTTAAWLHGLLPLRPGPVHLTVAGGSPRSVPGATVHTTQLLPSDERAERAGIPATSAGRTVVDCCASLSALAAQQLAADAIRRGVTSREELAELRRRRPRLPGTAALADLLDDDRVERLGSWLEAQFFPRLRRSGLRFVVNAPVGRDGSPVQNRADVVLLDAPVVVEFDGLRFHATPQEKQHDDRQQNDLVLDGWTVLRYSVRDVRRRPARVIEEIATAARRCRR